MENHPAYISQYHFYTYDSSNRPTKGKTAFRICKNFRELTISTPRPKKKSRDQNVVVEKSKKRKRGEVEGYYGFRGLQQRFGNDEMELRARRKLLATKLKTLPQSGQQEQSQRNHDEEKNKNGIATPPVPPFPEAQPKPRSPRLISPPPERDVLNVLPDFPNVKYGDAINWTLSDGAEDKDPDLYDESNQPLRLPKVTMGNRGKIVFVINAENEELPINIDMMDLKSLQEDPLSAEDLDLLTNTAQATERFCNFYEKWLCGGTVDSFLYERTLNKKRILLVPTSIGTILVRSKGICGQGVIAAMTKDLPWKDTEYILFPVNPGNNHWVGYIMDMKNQRIMYFNSQEARDPVKKKPAQRLLKFVRQFRTMADLGINNKDYNQDVLLEYQIVNADEMFRQPWTLHGVNGLHDPIDNKNCGLYLLYWMNGYIKADEPKWESRLPYTKFRSYVLRTIVGDCKSRLEYPVVPFKTCAVCKGGSQQEDLHIADTWVTCRRCMMQTHAECTMIFEDVDQAQIVDLQYVCEKREPRQERDNLGV